MKSQREGGVSGISEYLSFVPDARPEITLVISGRHGLVLVITESLLMAELTSWAPSNFLLAKSPEIGRSAFLSVLFHITL